MDFSLANIDIDGVSVPAMDALATVQTAITATDSHVHAVHQALAQPVGEALSQSKALCDSVKKRLKKFLAAIDKATAGPVEAVIAALGGYTAGVLDQSAQLVDAVKTATALGYVQTDGPGGSSVGVPPPAVAASAQPWYVWYYCPTSPADTKPALVYSPSQPDASYKIAFGPDTYSACKMWVGTDGAMYLRAHCGTSPLPSLPPSYPIGGIPAGPSGITGSGAGDRPIGETAAGGRCLYVDCQSYLLNPPSGGEWGLRVIGPCVGDTMPCPAGLACLSPVWHRYPGYVDDGQVGIAQYAQVDTPAFTDAVRAWCRSVGPPSLPPPPEPKPTPGPIATPPPVVTPTGGTLPSVCPSPAATNPCILPVKGIDCSQVNIPDILTIGSPSFCVAKDDIRRSFVQIGNAVVGIVDGLGLDDLITRAQGPDESWLTSPISSLLHGLWDAIIGWVNDDTKRALDLITGTIKCWYLALKTAKTCGLSDVLALSIAKSMVELLQRVRMGWDIAIWGTFDLTIHLTPLVKLLDYLIADACPAEIPAIGDTIEAYLMETITEDQAKCWLSLRGGAWEVWYPIIHSRRERLKPEEYIQWRRRQGKPDDETRDNLRTYGYLSDAARTGKIGVYDELPSISDVLHFLQRNVFDETYVKDFGLMEGFDERFAPRYLAGLRAIGMMEQTAKDHYAAHWINPSFGQLAEMAQRQRPGRVAPAVEFTWSSFLRVLAEQDVAPYFRERLRAISYRTLPIRQLTQLALSRAVSEDELSERWQDIGYKPEDAKMLAHALMLQAARQHATQQHGYTPAVVAKLWPAGQITREKAYEVLAPQGMGKSDVDTLLEVADKSLAASQYEKHTVGAIDAYAKLATKAYADGVVDRANAAGALAKAGYTADAISLELDTVALRVRMEKIDAGRAAVHKSFLRGEINVDEALAALVLVGVLEPSARDFLSRWLLEMTVPRKSAATAKILKWAKDGLLSVVNAEIRLKNLGWNPPDIVLMLAEIDQEIRHAKALAAQKSAAALAKAAAAAERAKKGVQKAYCRLYTPGKMKLWFAERIIDESLFRTRLVACGYLPVAIDDLLAESLIAREKTDAAKAKAAAGPKPKRPPDLAAGALRKLYAERIIDDGQLAAELTALGYTPDDVTEQLKDAQVARDKRDEQAAKKGPTGIEYTGPGAISG